MQLIYDCDINGAVFQNMFPAFRRKCQAIGRLVRIHFPKAFAESVIRKPLNLRSENSLGNSSIIWKFHLKYRMRRQVRIGVKKGFISKNKAFNL
jgi:hypothetical protein